MNFKIFTRQIKTQRNKLNEFVFTEKDCEESRRKEGGKDGSVFSIYYAYSNLHVLIPIIIWFFLFQELKAEKMVSRKQSISRVSSNCLSIKFI